MPRNALEYLNPELRMRVPVPNLYHDQDGNEHENPTQQHLKDATDINLILKRYDRDGVLTHVNQARAIYGDFTIVSEYQEALDYVADAQERFAELPSGIRKRFQNDPGQFVEFVTNPANLPEMYDLGLAERPPARAPAEEASEAPQEASAGPNPPANQ